MSNSFDESVRERLLHKEKTEVLDMGSDAPPAEAPNEFAAFEPGMVIDGRYQLESEIGRGGMGQVFRGTHLSLHIPIAIKVMLPSVSQNLDYARRFRREARSMSRLRHRNIAQVFDYGDVKGVPYMVIEFLAGESLATYLAGLEALPSLSMVRSIMLELVDAVEAAHRNGVVHRDLKPDNIFLALEADQKRIVKVLDFGLARVLDPKQSDGAVTEIGLIAGTPAYMSPEQCRSMDVGPSTDIYALGCLLTELLSGAPPFVGSSAAEIMAQHLFSEPAPLHRSAEAELVPRSLERLRLELLAKVPAKRPPKMSRIHARLIACLQEDEGDPDGRKNPAPSGTRDSRAAPWSADTAQGQTSSSGSLPVSLPPGRGVVAMIKWGELEHGVSAECVVGMTMHGWRSVSLGPDDEIPSDVDVIILDAAEEPQRACVWLEERGENWRGKVIVCGLRISRALPELIAAGAGDALSYPIDSGTLTRKIVRLLWELRAHASDASLDILVPSLPPLPPFTMFNPK